MLANTSCGYLNISAISASTSLSGPSSLDIELTPKQADYAIVFSELCKNGDGLTSPAKLLFEVVGAPLYDWRKDSTMGGSGSHRWDNQSTWEYSDNPAVQAYNLERGFFNGIQRMVGKAVRASRLPLAKYTQAANICDEIMTDGTKRYRTHAIAKDGPGANHDANLPPILEGMYASWVAQGDQNPIDYEGLAEDLKGYLGWIGPQMREIIRQAEELASTTAENHNANYSDIQHLSSRLTSTFNNAKASWEEDILVATGPNSAIGQQLIRIDTQLWDNTGASIVQLLQARVDGVEGEVEAQATAITSLTTVVNDVSANATFRMASSVAPSGWNSRIGMQVEGGTVGDWKSAGLFLDAGPNGARVAMIASQLVFSNGDEYFRPFVIQDGVMYGDAFVMDWAKFKTSRSHGRRSAAQWLIT